MTDPQPTAEILTGRCLCGAVRFRVAGPPLARRMCWCRDCQYLAAGNATVNLIVATAGFTLEGEVATYASTADSGNAMRRSFCPTCGTPLFSQSSARPDAMVVRAGTLDTPDAGRPDSIIWTQSAPTWATPDPALPQTPRQPT